MADRSKLYEKDKKESKPEPKKDAAPKGKDGENAEGEGGGSEVAEKGEDEGINKMFEGLGTMLKAHDSERRDHHGNYLAATKQMHQRHEKAIRDYMGQGMEGLKSTPDTGAEEVAPAPSTEAPAEA